MLSERRTVLVCGPLVALGPASMAIYTPAMPALVEHFDTTTAVITLSLTVYFGTFALAQLVCGPLSDGFGRRPIIIAFLSLYVLGSLVALGPGVEWLVTGRLIQGFGAAVGATLARAIVRDLHTGEASARLINMTWLVMGFGTAIAPTIGGVTLETLGWQGIFAVMALFGLAMVAVFAMLVPETCAHPDRGALKPARLGAAYRMLLGDARVMRPAVVLAASLGVFYVIATMLPFVLIDVAGLTPTQFGVAMIGQTGSFILGSLMMCSLMRRFPSGRLAGAGVALVAVGAALLAASMHTLPPSFATVMLPVAVFALGIPFMTPSMVTETLAPHPDLAGAASALLGFLQMGGAFVAAGVASAMGDPVLALGVVPTVMVLIATATWFAIPSPGRG